MRGITLPRLPRPRTLMAAAALAIAGAALFAGTLAPEPVLLPQLPLAERLEPGTWALALPEEWLSTPLPGVASGDAIDLLGARPSERAVVSEIAVGLRVMSAEGGGLVLELSADAAADIAEARARGLTLIPILRSRQ